MVNKKSSSSTRAGILSILRNASGGSAAGVSGEQMAASLGISRVAVWKGIQSLNENGYGIRPSGSGYMLEHDLTDSLFPWEFAADETRFRHWAETDSTMNRAREAALAGCDDGLVLAATRQSAGRGTGSKKWESVPGGLFFTIVTKPSLNSARAHRQVLAAQCAMASAIRSVSGINAVPVWPNDIYVLNGAQTGKAGGILSETLASGNMVSFLNLGIGINTGKSPAIAGTAAIPSGRKEILDEFLRVFSGNRYDSPDLANEWNALSPDTGTTVKFRINSDCTGSPRQDTQELNAAATERILGETAHKQLTEGIFRGVDSYGYAILETTNSATGTSALEQTHYPPGSITFINKGWKS